MCTARTTDSCSNPAHPVPTCSDPNTSCTSEIEKLGYYGSAFLFEDDNNMYISKADGKVDTLVLVHLYGATLLPLLPLFAAAAALDADAPISF